MQETSLAADSHSLVHFSTLFPSTTNSLSKKLTDSVRLLKNKTNGYVLKVVSDVSGDTEFFDLMKSLKTQGIVPKTEYCDRKTIEQISNIFPDRDISLKNEDMGLQQNVIAIFERAEKLRASDIHFRIEIKSAFVYFRVDGKRVFDSDYSAEHGKRLVNTLYNSMCTEQSEPSLSYSLPCDAKMREEFIEQLGLSTGRFASRPGGSDRILVVVRLIKRRTQRVAFTDLGLNKREAATILKILNKPSGIIFSSGPTGHGKSTLSQCMAEIVHENDKGVNIVTVEDPIESPIEGAYQTPLIIADKGNREVLGKAWGQAISNIMRLDPDWIYVGEVRDHTSATGAVEAAQTGHNVITTIHTQFAIDIISRLKNFGVDYDLLTDPTIITCLIGLRLVPLLCPNCRKPYSSNKKDVSEVFTEIIDKHTQHEDVFIKNNNGCPECNKTGLKGRTGVFEVIETNAKFMSIYQETGKIAAYEYWYKNGGITLCDNVLRLVNSGKIDPITAHKDICNLDRNYIMFSEDARNEVAELRKEWVLDE